MQTHKRIWIVNATRWLFRHINPWLIRVGRFSPRIREKNEKKIRNFEDFSFFVFELHWRSNQSRVSVCDYFFFCSLHSKPLKQLKSICRWLFRTHCQLRPFEWNKILCGIQFNSTMNCSDIMDSLSLGTCNFFYFIIPLNERIQITAWPTDGIGPIHKCILHYVMSSI